MTLKENGADLWVGGWVWGYSCSQNHPTWVMSTDLWLHSKFSGLGTSTFQYAQLFCLYRQHPVFNFKFIRTAVMLCYCSSLYPATKILTFCFNMDLACTDLLLNSRSNCWSLYAINNARQHFVSSQKDVSLLTSRLGCIRMKQSYRHCRILTINFSKIWYMLLIFFLCFTHCRHNFLTSIPRMLLWKFLIKTSGLREVVDNYLHSNPE